MRSEIGVTPAKAREPYGNEVVKRWTPEITRTTVAQRDILLTGGIQHGAHSHGWRTHLKDTGGALILCD
jgi:hypothetical protein